MNVTPEKSINADELQSNTFCNTEHCTSKKASKTKDKKAKLGKKCKSNRAVLDSSDSSITEDSLHYDESDDSFGGLIESDCKNDIANTECESVA